MKLKYNEPVDVRIVLKRRIFHDESNLNKCNYNDKRYTGNKMYLRI